MKVKRTKISDTLTKLNIEADAKFLDTAHQYTLKKLSGTVKIPGFREGKAPLTVIEKNLDPTRLQNEFLEESINSLYVQVLNSEHLRPVSDPKISIKKFVPFSTLEFEVEVEAVGEIQLPDYKRIRKQRSKANITAKDVNDVIKALQKRLAKRNEVTKPAKNGDEVVIDFKGVNEKKEPIKGADGTDYPLILGSSAFIPGFESELVGLKGGDEKTFVLTFPKDYGVKTLASKKVTFTVNIKKVQEVVELPADDSFAAQAGPFKTIDELKADIKKQIGLERQAELDKNYQNELLQSIADKSNVVIPKVLVDNQIERAEQDERQNITYKGQTWQEHLDEEGITEEEHHERNRPTAENSVKIGLVLSEIADREAIKVTPEEIEIRIQLLKGQYKDPAMQAELDKPENRQDIVSRLMTEKTLAKLIDYVSKKN